MRAVSNGDRRHPFQELLWAKHHQRFRAATMPLAARRIWPIAEIDPLFLIAAADSVGGALQETRSRGSLEHSEVQGRIRVEIRIPLPKPAAAPGSRQA
jgi:hypothetical protein